MRISDASSMDEIRKVAEKTRRNFRSWLSSWIIASLIKRRYFSASRSVVWLIVSCVNRLAQEVFAQLHRFLDPVKKHNSESYEDFHDVWGKDVTEKDRPSFTTKKSINHRFENLAKLSATWLFVVSA